MLVSPSLDVYLVDSLQDKHSLNITISAKHNRNNTTIETPTLIDSGAGGTFIDQNYVRKVRYKLTELEIPVKAYNVDCQKPLLKLNGIMTSMIENSWQSYEL